MALACVCLAMGSGCIGIEHHVRGVVLHTQSQGCGDVPVRTAVSGATVRLECPGEEAIEVITEMGGRFRLAPEGLTADCTVVVTKPGYRDRRYAVAEICVDPVGVDGHCEAASMTAHLVPSRAAAMTQEPLP